MNIAIIGGGFSGTLTAVHLLRAAARGSRVVIINRSGAMARGVAYGTQSDHHVLNVPAGRMSAFDDDPDSFVRFVGARGVAVDGGAFVSRHLYGAYLEWLLQEAADRATAAGGVLERITAEVLTVVPSADGTHAWVALADGTRRRADRVVLAVGNYPPLNPPVLDDRDGSATRFFTTSPRYVADPWRPGALAAAATDRQWPTLLVGTGLTMIDIALELGTGCIAISRRGLLPIAHRGASHPPDRSELPPELAGPASVTATARHYLHIARRHIRDAESRGVDWRDVIAALRPLTPRLWQALPLAERRRFLRHVRPFWEVHRHRVAPALHASFTAMRDAGDLRMLAGRLVSIREDGDRVIVHLQPRGSRAQAPIALTVGLVVNCTGPAADTRRLRDALFERLQADGLLRPDPLGLGIETTADGAVIGADGRTVPALYYVGPFLKARDWEATAVPELREYARGLAAHLIETLSPAPAGERSPTEARIPD